MTEDQLLMWWATFHPCSQILFWVLIGLFPLVFLALHRRIRTTFLMLFSVASVVYLVAEILNEVHPDSPHRTYSIGVLIEILWLVYSVVTLVAMYLCFRWFWKTRNTQPPSAGDSSPRADAGLGTPEK